MLNVKSTRIIASPIAKAVKNTLSFKRLLGSLTLAGLDSRYEMYLLVRKTIRGMVHILVLLARKRQVKTRNRAPYIADRVMSELKLIPRRLLLCLVTFPSRSFISPILFPRLMSIAKKNMDSRRYWSGDRFIAEYPSRVLNK